MTPGERLSETVVEAVAAAEGVDPTDLSETLYPAINADALDVLFVESSGSVTFEYNGYEITVASDGDVSVESLDAA
ncbi:HalOD1 output domain-containing protein [Haloarcula marina]|uniref:HalOD1 output domain-containing protein n=1 Tax=Haloarcula marina TaxID=2961574 RepID=UPI0020B668ED|nr:HalOD1 output domain-containing protein [Halomicroarcula marina]